MQSNIENANTVTLPTPQGSKAELQSNIDNAAIPKSAPEVSYNIKSNKVVLKHPVSGSVKIVPLRFSWTMLFFGPLVPLFRGDLKWFLISLITYSIIPGLPVVIFPFFYNKLYVKKLLAKGFVPADENSVELLAKKGIKFNN